MNHHGLPHGLHYVTRDGSAIYELTGTSDGPSRLGGDETESAVALALIDVATARVRRAHRTTTNRENT